MAAARAELQRDLRLFFTGLHLTALAYAEEATGDAKRYLSFIAELVSHYAKHRMHYRIRMTACYNFLKLAEGDHDQGSDGPHKGEGGKEQ
jgi:hypothetical protein